MDPTTYTLFLAMGAALCAAFISGWLLHMMVSEGLFWVVVFSNMISAPIGLYLPGCCGRNRRWVVLPTVSILSATLLSVLVSVTIVIVERAALEQVNANDLMSDELVRTLIAVAGIAMATSLIVFLIRYTSVQEAAELRRVLRRAKRFMLFEPKPKLTLCDDFASVAPGECAICLDDLASLPVEPDCPPATSSKACPNGGLLRLPCQHTFHCSCAHRWIAREVNCPMCRTPIGSLGKCVQICLRGGPPACVEAGGGGGEEPSSAQAADGGSDCGAWVITEVESEGTGEDLASVAQEMRVVVAPADPKGAATTPCARPAAAGTAEERSHRLEDVGALRVLEADGDEDLP